MNAEPLQNPLLTTTKDSQILVLLFRLVIAFSIIGCAIGSVVVAANQQEILVGFIGTFILIIASIPLYIRRDYSLFEPATFVILLVLFGTPLKLLYVISSHTEDRHVAQILMNFENPDFLIPALAIVAVSWVFFVVGYLVKIPKSPLGNLFMPRRDAWSGRYLQIILVALMAVSIACFVAFILTAGVSFSSLSGLSQKRFSDEAGTAASRIHSTKYFLYRGAAISKFLVYFGLVWLLSRNKRFMSWTGALVLFALFQTMFLSFVISNRAGIVLILIDCLVIFFYMRNTLSVRSLLIAFGVVCALLIPMLAVRGKEDLTLSKIAQKTLAGRDLLDITKTCHIIRGVPKRMDFVNGETLFGWMAAPIPSSMWEGKPMWAGKGPYINQHIFKDKAGISGVPPGLIAEFYWNFGYFGVFAGMFVLGLFLRHLFETFRQFIGNPSSVLIYTLIVTRFGIFALGSDLGTGIIKTALDLVPVMVILLFVGYSSSIEESGSEHLETMPANVPLPAGQRDRKPPAKIAY